VEFDTDNGVTVIDLSILDWNLCRMAILELLAQPHSSMPYVHMGFMKSQYSYKRTILKGTILEIKLEEDYLTII
jgi:hypothetical protein